MGVPSKLEFLLRMTSLSRPELDLTVQAERAARSGNLDGAIAANERLIAVLRDHLELIAAHNRRHPDPIDRRPIARSLVNTLTTQADHLQSRGDLSRAERLRKEAHELAGTHFGSVGEADERRRSAAVLTSQGRFAEALTALADAGDFYEANGNLLQMARVTIDRADLLHWLGDFDRASRELDHAAALVAPRLASRPKDPASLLGEVLAGFSDIARGAGDGSRAVDAVELHRIATELDYYRGLAAKGRGDHLAAAEAFGRVRDEYANLNVGEAIDFQLADVLRRQGRHRECLDLARRLEPLFLRDQRFRPKHAALLRVMGESALAIGEPASALDLARRGAGDLEKFHDPDVRWSLQWLEARALEKLGRGDEALDAFRRAVATIASLRVAPLGYRLDSTFLREKRPLFDSAIRTAFELERIDAFCEFSEQIKSRSLSVVLSSAPGPADPKQARPSRFDQLSREIDALEYQRYAGQGDAAELDRRRDQLVRERGELLERLRFSDPRWRTLTVANEWTLRDLEPHLGRIAVLTLVVSGNRVLAALLRSDRRRLSAVPLSEELSAKLDAYAANLQSPSPDPLAYDASERFGIGVKHLVDPETLEEALDAEALIVVPHGVLHLLPWAGLIFRGRRLFDYLPVGILPNLRCLVRLGAANDAAPRAALVGAPDYAGLPGLATLDAAAREIETLRRLYSAEKRLIEPVLAGPLATEAAFLELVGRDETEGATLHIACHGMPEPAEPLASGLLLSGSRVDAGEIARLRIRCADVVLSACRTGWRPTQVDGVALAGDEILGLPAAFLEAGATSVLVSIPESDDSAASELMVLYHRRRLEGQTPLRALQSAQKEMLKSRHEPWSWIGYSLYGCR